jgi:hypothetical protein
MMRRRNLHYLQIGGAVEADDRNINLRRQGKIEDLSDHVGSLKIKPDRWEGSR